MMTRKVMTARKEGKSGDKKTVPKKRAQEEEQRGHSSFCCRTEQHIDAGCDQK